MPPLRNGRGRESPLGGIAHSHPNGVLRLSRGDVSYAEAIVAANPQIKELYFAVAVQAHGTWNLVFYNCMKKSVSEPEEVILYVGG